MTRDTRPLRLGEVLLQHQAITPADLHDALSRQIVHGGRIGSNLIEIEAVSIDTVAQALGSQLLVPVAELGGDEIRPETLRVLPPRTCQRLGIVPLRLHGTTLHLGMQDPTRLDILRPLGSLLGVNIQPYVVPQLRLLYLLERHYGLVRPVRYLRETAALVADDRRRYLQPTVGAGTDLLPAPSGTQRGWAPARVDGDPLQYHVAYLDDPRGPLAEAHLLADELTGALDGRSWDDAYVDRSTVDDVLATLSRTETRNEVIAMLVKPFLLNTTLSALLLPRGDVAVALAAAGTVLTTEQLSGLAVPLRSPSLLRQALHERTVASGVASKDPLQEMIAGYLRAPTPAYASVAPIRLGAHTANLLCVQTATRPTSDDIDALARLAQAGSAAYARLMRHPGAQREALVSPTLPAGA